MKLDGDERRFLQGIVDGGKGSAERRRRAHPLLLADRGREDGGRTDADVASVLCIGMATVERVRRQCVLDGLEAALERKVQRNRSKCTLDGNRAPDAQENCIKPWLRKTWCIPPKANAEFACAMEDVLSTCSRDFDDGTVLACLDDASKQQVRETRTPPPLPGRSAGQDFEYKRNGTANMFMIHAPLLVRRHVEVTDRRTRQDFARVLRDIADVHFPGRRIALAIDNPDTHRLSTLCETFLPAEALRIAGRFEIHHTPKHGSWLNMAELEINALRSKCLDRRIPNRDTLCREVAAWQRDRNGSA